MPLGRYSYSLSSGTLGGMSAAEGNKNVSESQMPPVMVMNLHYTGIGIARNLSGVGIRVYGLSSERDAPGMRSRLFQAVYLVHHSRDDPETLCEELMALRRQQVVSP